MDLGTTQLGKFRSLLLPIEETLPEINTAHFNIAVSQLKIYIIQEYNLSHEINREKDFVSDLFLEIHRHRKKSSFDNKESLVFIFLLHCLLDLRIGEKISKANQIANSLFPIPPSRYIEFSYFLRDILVWLSKILRKVMTVIFQPLAKIVVSWTTGQPIDSNLAYTSEDSDLTRICGFNILSIMITSFPIFEPGYYNFVSKVIFVNVTHPSQNVREALLRVLKTALNSPNPSIFVSSSELMSKFLVAINSGNPEFFEWAVDPFNLILDAQPGLIKTVQIQQIPIQHFSNKDAKFKVPVMKILPVMYRASPKLFTAEILNTIFKVFEGLIKKRTPNRPEALMGLAGFLFERGKNITYTEKNPECIAIDKCKKAIIDGLDCPESIYAYISTLCITPEQFDKNTSLIFSQPISELLIQALLKFADLFNKQRNIVYLNIISMIAKLILDPTLDQTTVIYIFKALRHIFEITNRELFGLPFVMQCSIHMGSETIEARKAVADFLLDYQRKKPSLEILHILLAAISTESNDEFRLRIFHELRRKPEDESIAPSLQSMLHDLNSDIRNESLKYLTQLSNYQSVRDLLNDFLNETVHVMQNANGVPREQIQQLLIVSNGKYGNQLLSPFAPFLINHLLLLPPPLMTPALRLLAKILPLSPNTANQHISSLSNHIGTRLTVHSSLNQLEASHQLLVSALENTSLRFSIYNDQMTLLFKLIDVSRIPSNPGFRRSILQTIGSIGAISPSAIILKQRHEMDQSRQLTTANKYVAKSSSNEPIYSLIQAAVSIVILNLLDILRDDSLTTLHELAVEKLLLVLKTHRPFADDLEAELLKQINFLMAESSDSTTSILLNNMQVLISVLKDFSSLVPHVIDLIFKNWEKQDRSLFIRNCNWLRVYIPEEFSKYIQQIVSLFVSDLDTNDDKVLDEILSACETFGHFICSVDHILHPAILKWIQNNAMNTSAVKSVLSHFKKILIQAGAVKFSTEVISTMIELVRTNPAVSKEALDLIYIVAVQIREQFVIYLPIIRSKFDIAQNTNLLKLTYYYRKGTPFDKIDKSIITPVMPPPIKPNQKEKLTSSSVSNVNNTPNINDIELPKITQPQKDFTEAQWSTWGEEFFRNIISCSSCRAIVVCESVADRHSTFRDAITPLALALVYFLFEKKQDNDMRHIVKLVLESHNCPRQIVRYFLSLLEIIEVLGLQFPINIKLVASGASSADRMAQSLRAYEALFKTGDMSSTEPLIIYNQSLGLPLAAKGVLKVADMESSEIIQGSGDSSVYRTKGALAERLGQWENALYSYDEKLKSNPDDEAAFNGRLNCLRALCRYKEFKQSIQSQSENDHYALSKASADWRLLHTKDFLQDMELILRQRDLCSQYSRDPEFYFFAAVKQVMLHDYSRAQKNLSQARTLISDSIIPTISEDYERVYKEVALNANFSELEDVIHYLHSSELLHSTIPDERDKAKQNLDRIRRSWDLSFGSFSRDPSIMYNSLCVKSLVLSADELYSSWLELLGTAIDTRRFELAQIIIDYLSEKATTQRVELDLLKCRLLWAEDGRTKAIENLSSILPKITDPSIGSSAWRQIGIWYGEAGNSEEARKALSRSVELDESSIVSWKLWTRVNLQLYEQTRETSYLVDSFSASLKGLELTPNDPLSFTLNILSTLFRRGKAPIYAMFQEHAAKMPVRVWINVLPQIIARSNSKEPTLHAIISDLITAIGAEYPDVVLYSLMVPYMSPSDSDRRRIARSIFGKLVSEYPLTVHAIQNLTNELIRASVSWWEMWNGKLDDASRAYISKHDMKEMSAILMPLHEILRQQPATYHEIVFTKQFGQMLRIAGQWLDDYHSTQSEESLHQAWAIYISVFHKLKGVLQEMTKIPLADASPYLYNLRNPQLTVPGTDTRIARVDAQMSVMMSKQRPRRMAIFGEDGNKYTFLLKAHEDTRLDERVMQFFALLNSLIEHSSIPLKEKLTITTYRIIPLTGQTGLIGWVPECSTVYDMVKEYRTNHGIPLEIEYQETLATDKSFDSPGISIEAKEKAFSMGFLKAKRLTKGVAGNELKSILLAFAVDSNHWLERRTAYATSLAMTSMSGYLLGLGDRHLCNIMFKQESAKLVHIDFGDCFEVDQIREKCPEKVPFRLTHILENALEVSGIEGTFRDCCENYMECIRSNGDQILELLEVFIYDPLLQWIDSSNNEEVGQEKDEESPAAVGIVKRIQDKLEGNDFVKVDPQLKELDVKTQVDRLIKEATSHKNLCQMFRGWFPWW